MATIDPTTRKLVAHELARASLAEADAALAAGDLRRAGELQKLTRAFIGVRDSSSPARRSRHAPINWEKLAETRTRR